MFSMMGSWGGTFTLKPESSPPSDTSKSLPDPFCSFCSEVVVVVTGLQEQHSFGSSAMTKERK